ncbi:MULTISPECIES: ABC transporter permease [unclassified Aureimonas]|uniref:ABC transporter permease n=1 Tax=unclassified Aureimonas TaxID=2615206 RepID=UPI0006F9D82B|nr:MULTISPECIES: ABC transporter permease [unclassified Aureimonas]KQT52523.1 glutathione ABC transporter permease [Aureimonas sp. Leaf427]KQT77576.1 glutathione ABC transporter permease [Aureimonas sp. Leaf460]
MIGYALRRTAAAFVLIWLVATLIFMVLHVIPGDPAELLLSQGGMSPDPAIVADLREQLGLNRPLPLQYVTYVSNVLRGDLGVSLQDGYPILDEVLVRLPRTMELILAAGLIAASIGIPMGTLAAVRSGSAFDKISSTLASIAVSVPVFVVGTLAVLVFAQILKLIPAGGFVAFSDDPLRHLSLLVMPAGAIAIGLAGILFRVTRNSVLEVLGREFIRVARAKGLPRSRIIVAHALRNALIPIVTVLALQLGMLLGGTVLVEYVFNWPGLSGYLVRAVEARDYPEVMGIVLVISTIFVFLNLAIDLLYAVLDPRVGLTR